MTDLLLASAPSKLVIRTRAAGMLARLAHDLEISAAELRGRAQLDGDAWSADLEIPVAALRVAGVLHGDRLDPAALSASDRREIERKMREEVLHGTNVVRVHASGVARDQADARVALSGGGASVTARLTTRGALETALEVSGKCQLSLRALGVREIKGPLGAFKVRDDVEILFDLTLRPAG